MSTFKVGDRVITRNWGGWMPSCDDLYSNLEGEVVGVVSEDSGYFHVALDNDPGAATFGDRAPLPCMAKELDLI